MYEYILFDLDGTLTDPGLGITNSVAYALKRWNIEVEDRKSLYKFIGPPLQDSFAQYYGFSAQDALRAVDVYITRIRDKFSASEDFRIVTVHGLGYKAVPTV